MALVPVGVVPFFGVGFPLFVDFKPKAKGKHVLFVFVWGGSPFVSLQISLLPSKSRFLVWSVANTGGDYCVTGSCQHGKAGSKHQSIESWNEEWKWVFPN